MITSAKASTKKMAKHLAAKKMLNNIEYMKTFEEKPVTSAITYDPNLLLDKYITKSDNYKMQPMNYCMTVSEASKVFLRLPADKVANAMGILKNLVC